MDSDNSRKITELAQNLKKLHLAATMEEATQRAKEMLEGSPKEKEEPVVKSLSELYGELTSKADQLEKRAEFAELRALEAEKKLERIEGDFELDKQFHELEKSDTEALSQDIKSIKKGAEEIKELIKQAELVQKHSPEKK